MSVSFTLELRGQKNGRVEVDRFLRDKYIFLEVRDDSTLTDPLLATVTLRPGESRRIRKALKQAEKAIRDERR